MDSIDSDKSYRNSKFQVLLTFSSDFPAIFKDVLFPKTFQKCPPLSRTFQ